MKIDEIRKRAEQIVKMERSKKFEDQLDAEDAELALLKTFIRGLTKGFVNGVIVRAQAKELVKFLDRD